jgi:tRNA-specific 2-thiouridylase
VKFGLLLDRLANAEGVDFDLFATGHYCRIAEIPGTGRLAIRAAEDHRKDQSYFLCMLNQEQLSRVVFPLGGMKKPEVREIARAAGLSNHARAESQDFAAGGYKAIVSQADKAGPIIDTAGKVIGEHKGVWGYTIGQRRGLGIGGGEPLYVTRIDAGTNTVVAGPESSLFRRELVARSVNWASRDEPMEAIRLQVKVRYRNPAVPALVTPVGEGSVLVRFDEPQRAIARGQWAVFYDEDILVGGGVIAD